MNRARAVMSRISSFFRQETGVQLVELAIVLPILLVFLAAIAEFGRFFYIDLTLGKATRAGARYLTTRQLTADEINNAKSLVICGDPTVNSVCSTPVVSGLTPAMVKITPTSGIPNIITVEIQDYQFEPIFDLGALTSSSVSLRVNVSPSTTMKYLLS